MAFGSCVPSIEPSLVYKILALHQVFTPLESSTHSAVLLPCLLHPGTRPLVQTKVFFADKRSVTGRCRPAEVARRGR